MELSESNLASIVIQLDQWLESTRCNDGYGGPVAHWWQNCLQYTGAGLDWRYEGIIIGYLNLYNQTKGKPWLGKAKRAGFDLVRGQMPNGNYRNSNFEANPYSGGTPHEAACDNGLLSLAEVLRKEADSDWEIIAAAAENNLKLYLIERLWEPNSKFFRDSVNNMLLVLNKAATAFEAFYALASLTGKFEMVDQIGRPTLDSIVANQVHAIGSVLDGAIDQSVLGSKPTGAYYPFYNARCIPALIKGYEWTSNEEYIETAFSAMKFIQRLMLPDGSFPQVIYSNGKVNRYPQWIAGVGDILRSMELLQKYGLKLSEEYSLSWLIINGRQPTGGFKTAYGFASQASQKTPPVLPDFLDILPVCGWVDKAFRYLTGKITKEVNISLDGMPEINIDCLFQNKNSRYHENDRAIEVWQDNKLVYRWQKGYSWADMPVFFG